ncbi:MAG: S16 family serine protease, partial [Candidatus Bathyarchaeia archaeon]
MLKKVAALSIATNVLLLAGVVYQQVGYSSLTSQLVSLNQNLTSEVANLRQTNQQLENQLTFYKKQIEDLTISSEKELINQTLAVQSAASVNIVAVQTLANGSMKGVIMKAEVEIHPGSGRVLVNIMPEVGFDLQTSVISGMKVVEDITELSLDNTDIIVTIIGAGKVDAVDGPSAGAALTIAMLAAVQNKEIDDTIFITGTVNRDGSIGRVGGVLAKAIATASSGASTFLVPAGQTQ